MVKNKKLNRFELEQKISDLEIKLNEQNSNSQIKENEHSAEVASLKQVHDQALMDQKLFSDAEITDTKNQVEDLNKQLKQKQTQLDDRELKKLASAYRDQEGFYTEDAAKWLKALKWITGILLISSILLIWLSSGQSWYDKLEYYVIDFILISTVWFCGAQYSNRIKLKNDYANRKTLAQSFHNILNNLAEDQAIKDKFIEKATDVLCASSVVADKEAVLSKKVVKDTIEIIKSIRE